MNTQTRVLFSALALALAAGTLGGVHAQERGAAGDPATESQAPAAGGTGDTTGTMGDSGAAGTPGATAQTTEIMNLKAGEITGRQVYNSENKQLGKVDMIARDKDSGDLSAIITVGGFLGFGGSKVAVPLQQLSLQDDKLILSTAMSKKELRQQSPGYQEQRYEAIAEDTTLSQVAASTAAATGMDSAMPQSQMEGTPPATAGAPPSQGPAVPGGTASFQSLDRNSDGYLTTSEVSGNQQIVAQWSTLDTNSDGRLDRSEFAAFESRSQTQAPQAGGGGMAAISDFNSLDSNGDGQISNQEAVRDQKLMGQWSTLDTNRDGMLSRDEFTAYSSGKGSAAGGTAMGSDTMGGGFQALDQNSDGYITSDEAATNQSLVSQWTTLDVNQDNRIDRAEFAAFEQLDSMEGGQAPVPSAPMEPGSESGQPSGAMPGGQMQ